MRAQRVRLAIVASSLFATAVLAGKVTITTTDPVTGVRRTQTSHIGEGETVYQPAAPVASSDEARPWLVEVSSIYRDEGSRRLIRIRGSGALVRVENRYFVLTASHVSQGRDLRVLYRAPEPVLLSPLRRLAGNLRDIEWIEVKAPSLSWSRRGFSQDFSFLADYRRMQSLLELRSELSFFWERQRLEQRTDFSFLPGFRVALDDRASLPLPSWMSDRERIAIQQEQPLRRALSLTNFGFELRSPVKIAGGASGAPVIFDIERGWPYLSIVAGCAVRVSRDFSQSYYAPSMLAIPLLDELLRGRQGELDGFSWHLRAGLTYRVGQGLTEINPVSQSVGDLIPVGNGTEADGGNGTEADGGNGTEADGGGGLSQNSELWKKFGIEPGLVINGEPSLAFTTPDSLNRAVPVYATLHAAQALAGTLLERFNAKSDLVKILSSRLVAMGELKSSATTFRLLAGSNSEALVTDKGLRFRLQISRELLAFDLDRNGAALNAVGFRPVLRVSSRSRVFVIDLRDFFFADPGRLELPFSPLERLPSLEAWRKVLATHQPTLWIRELSTHQEEGLVFRVQN